jgi:acylphosphatase
MTARAVNVLVHGRVQGVGFRMFVEREAVALGLAGWVRNVRDGTVEAVFSGDDGAMEQMLAACRRGPPGSLVTNLEVFPAAIFEGGFEVRPTA